MAGDSRRRIVHEFFAGRSGVLPTKHGKEEIIAPLLYEALGITLEVPPDFDTDLFGTFTGVVARPGTQHEALRAKLVAAMQGGGFSLGVASEGSFNPHPWLPAATVNLELVILLDWERGVELVGQAVTTQTNFGRRSVNNLDDALIFAREKGFPAHAMVIKRREGHNNPAEVRIGLDSEPKLAEAFYMAQDQSEDDFLIIETDMRAHVNPSRRQCIDAATRDLIARVYNICPACGFVGMAQAVITGLPCSWCGEPTNQARGVESTCRNCSLVSVTGRDDSSRADPSHCRWCNP